MAKDPPLSATDDNKAAFVASTNAPVCYHCPNTNCSGHYYLSQEKLGQDLTCTKCGLAVTIGKTTDNRASAVAYCLVSLLLGALAGFLIAMRFR